VYLTLEKRRIPLPTPLFTSAMKKHKKNDSLIISLINKKKQKSVIEYLKAVATVHEQ